MKLSLLVVSIFVRGFSSRVFLLLPAWFPLCSGRAGLTYSHPPTPKSTHLQLIQAQSSPPPISFKRADSFFHSLLVCCKPPCGNIWVLETSLISFTPACLL